MQFLSSFAVMMLLGSGLAQSANGNNATTPLLPQSRIIGGNVAQPNRYNYMVHIVIDNQTSCGGSLIAKNMVLTAAHCIGSGNPNGYMIRGHIHNLRTERGERLRATKILRHPSFNPNSLSNDVALIQIDPNHNINTFLSLDSGNYAQSINSPLRVTGWGRVVSMGQGSDVLKELDMKVLDPQICSRNIQRMDVRSHFCATGVQLGSTACQGDSGSPVVSPDLKTVVGVVSYGTQACNAPSAAFTRISSFLPWIQQYIQQGNSQNPSPNPSPNPQPPTDNGSYPKGSCSQPSDTICFGQTNIGVCINTRSAHSFECPYNSKCKIHSNGKAYCA